MFLSIKKNNEQEKSHCKIIFRSRNPLHVFDDITDEQGLEPPYTPLYKRSIKAFFI